MLILGYYGLVGCATSPFVWRRLCERGGEVAKAPLPPHLLPVLALASAMAAGLAWPAYWTLFLLER